MRSDSPVPGKLSKALSAAATLYIAVTVICIMCFIAISAVLAFIALLSAAFGPGQWQPEGAQYVIAYAYVSLLIMSITGSVGANAILRRTSFTKAAACGWTAAILNGSIAIAFSWIGHVGAIVYILFPFVMLIIGILLVHGQRDDFPVLVGATQENIYRA